MATHSIEIKGSNTTNGKLILYDNGIRLPDDGSSEAEVGDEINWTISDPNVFSFRIEKKDNSQNIWKTLHHPPSHHTKNGGGRVGGKWAAGKKYRYTIHWKISETDPEKHFDPIISIRPRSSFTEKLIIGTLVTGILAFLSISFYQEFLRKNKK